MAKIKILYTIPNFDTAGSGKVLYDLAKGLNKEKFDVSIACKNDKGDFFKEVQQLELPIHLIDTTRPLKPYYSLLLRVKPIQSFFKKSKFDVIHSWHWSSDWSEIVAAKFAGAKFVYTKKAMTWGNVHWKIKSFLADFIITINEDMKAYFPNKKGQKLIPLGLDMQFYNPALFEQKKNNDRFKIITVANLVAVKNIETLIKAIYQLQNSQMHLDILGDTRSDYADELKELVNELKLEKQVVFLDKQIDVRAFLVQSDLYVIPSKKEGMPVALVEAMAMELPVLGSNISGINFVLKDFPELLFPSQDIEILSQRINEMYHKTEEERKTIGQQLRTYVSNHFSIERFIKSHEELYLQIAKKR